MLKRWDVKVWICAVVNRSSDGNSNCNHHHSIPYSLAIANEHFGPSSEDRNAEDTKHRGAPRSCRSLFAQNLRPKSIPA